MPDETCPKRWGSFLAALLLVLVFSAGCAENDGNALTPDYADPGCWVSLPEASSHDADTFFILPTVNMKETVPGNEDFTDERSASRFVKTFLMESGKLVVTDAGNLDELYASTGTLFAAGDYHLYDLNLFFRNLQKNVADRIESFTDPASATAP